MAQIGRIQRWRDNFWRRFLPGGPLGFIGTMDDVRMTWRRVANLRRLQKEYASGAVTLRSRPVKLILESTNVCNLKCTACFTGLGENGRVRSAIDMGLYRRVLDELGDTLMEMEFYNWGESLLNKSIFTMVEIASSKGIGTEISTNFSIPFDEARAEALVRSGLSVLSVSLDGATQENYEKYRKGGDFQLALRNAQMVIDARARLGSATPRMVWSFHVFPHNVDEVEMAQARSVAMGFDEFYAAKGLTYGEEWDDPRYSYFIPTYQPVRCSSLWHYAVVHNDGGVAGCGGAFYQEDDFGRLSSGPGDPGARTFAEIWNGKQFQAGRSLYAQDSGHVPPGCDSLCAQCPQTKTYRSAREHVESGKPLATFKPLYSPNDGHKYFYSRRPARETRAPVRKS